MSKILSHKPSKQLQTHTLRPFWAGFWFFVDHKRFNQTPSKRGVPFHARRPRQWPRALFGWHHWRLHTWRRSAYWAVTCSDEGCGWRVWLGLVGVLSKSPNIFWVYGEVLYIFRNFKTLRWERKASKQFKTEKGSIHQLVLSHCKQLPQNTNHILVCDRMPR